MLLRKQILITEAQEDYLHALSEAIGQSQGHIVREAIDLHARQLNPDSIPSLIYDEPTTKGEPNEPKS